MIFLLPFCLILVVAVVIMHIELYSMVGEFSVGELLSKESSIWLKILFAVPFFIGQQFYLYGGLIIFVSYASEELYNKKYMEIYTLSVITSCLGLLFLFIFYVNNYDIDISNLIGVCVWLIVGFTILTDLVDDYMLEEKSEESPEEHYMIYKDVTIIRLDNKSNAKKIEKNYHLSLFGEHSIEIFKDAPTPDTAMCAEIRKLHDYKHAYHTRKEDNSIVSTVCGTTTKMNDNLYEILDGAVCFYPNSITLITKKETVFIKLNIGDKLPIDKIWDIIEWDCYYISENLTDKLSFL
ncbi:MAG: hypothetical protein IJ180_04695 [Bacteroidales bacterium]|nr:hypothetical protein [Bacteroidales bacterium]